MAIKIIFIVIVIFIPVNYPGPFLMWHNIYVTDITITLDGYLIHYVHVQKPLSGNQMIGKTIILLSYQ